MYEKSEDRRKQYNPKRKDTPRNSFGIDHTLYGTTLSVFQLFIGSLYLDSILLSGLGLLVYIAPTTYLPLPLLFLLFRSVVI
jgi:hypothetical protein